MGLSRMWKRARLLEISPEMRAKAIEVLREGLPEDIQIELRDRITSDPENWLMGRKNINRPCDCSSFTDTGEPWVLCVCRGTGIQRDELPLHFGWGTAVRNFLRDRGCGEQEMGVENLDDYYCQLLELAAMGDSYYGELK